MRNVGGRVFRAIVEVERGKRKEVREINGEGKYVKHVLDVKIKEGKSW